MDSCSPGMRAIINVHRRSRQNAQPIMLTHTYLEPSSARPRERQHPQLSPSGQAPWFLVHVTRETERGKARGINAPAGEYVTDRAVTSNMNTNGSSLVCMAWSDRNVIYLVQTPVVHKCGLGHTFASPSFMAPSRGPMSVARSEI